MTNTNPSTDALKENAIQTAARWITERPVYIDTETTGLEKTDEIVEISIVDFDGSVLYSSLVKPSKPIPAEASRIHGITNEMVASMQSWLILWPTIRNFLYGRTIAAYNAPFDMRMMQQSHAAYKFPWRENFKVVDVLPLYSDYRGVWNPVRGSMKYFKLEEAGAFFQIALPNAHRSTADSLLTRAVLHSMAGQPY
jgi:DNA polymerase III subunit epsilon